MKILMTGFDPFGKDTFNPSFEAVKLLDDKVSDVEIKKLQLPTEFVEAFETLQSEIKNNEYTHIILTGQAAGRVGLSLEKYALNIMNSKGPDNAEYTPKHEIIDDGGEHVLVSQFDLVEISTFLNTNGVQSDISYHAGTFVCNCTYYKLLNYINKHNLNASAIFIHVPIVEDQLINHKADTPYSTIEEISYGLSKFIEHLTI